MSDFKQTGIAIGVDASAASAGAAEAKAAFREILESAQATATSYSAAWTATAPALQKAVQAQTVFAGQTTTAAGQTRSAFQSIVTAAQQLAAQVGTGLQNAGGRFTAFAAQVKASALQAKEEIGGMVDKIFNLGTAFEALLAGLGIHKILEVQSQMQSFETTIEALSGSLPSARAEMKFLNDLVDRLGLDLGTAQQAYATFLAQVKDTPMQGQKARDTFVGVSEAITAMHIPAQRAQLIFLALQEIAGQNVMTAQHLNRQLGMELPGSINAMAKGLGITVQQLHAMIHAGQLTADVALPALGKALHEQWGDAAEAASNKVQASMNRVSTSVTRFIQDIGNGQFGEAFADLSRKIFDGMKGDKFKQLANDIGGALAAGARLAGVAFQFLSDHAKLVEGVLAALATGKVLFFFKSMVDMAILAGKAMIGLAIANPFGAFLVAVAAAVGLLIAFKDTTIEVGGHTAAVRDYVTTAWEGIKQVVGAAWGYMKGLPKWISDNLGPKGWESVKYGVVFAMTYFTGFGNTMFAVFKSGIELVSRFAYAFYDAPSRAIDLVTNKLQSFAQAAKALLAGDFTGAKGFLSQVLLGNNFDFTSYFDGMGDQIAANFKTDWIGDIGQKAAGVFGIWGEKAGQAYAARMKKGAKTPDLLGDLIGDGPPGAPSSKPDKIADNAAKAAAKIEEQARANDDLAAAYLRGADAVQQATIQHKINEFEIQHGILTEQKYAELRERVTKAVNAEVTSQQRLKAAQFVRQTTDDNNDKFADISKLIEAQKALNVASAAGVFQEQQAAAAYRATEFEINVINKIRKEGKDVLDKTVVDAAIAAAKRLTAGEQELAQLRAQNQAIHQLQEAYEPQKTVNALVAQYNSLRDQGLITEKVYKAAVRDANEAAAQQFDDLLMRTKTAIGGAQAALNSYARDAKNAAKNMSDFFGNAMSSIESTLGDFFTKGKADWASFAQSIMADFAKIIIRSLITGPLASALSQLFAKLGQAASGGGGGFWGSILASIGGAIGGAAGGTTIAKSPATGAVYDGTPFANGGIMTPGGALRLNKYSKGGIATGPQLALYGENRQNEAYVPLPDGRRIPVSMSGSQQPMNINFNIIDRTSTKTKVTKGPQTIDIKGMVQNVYLDDMDTNGVMRQASQGGR